MKQQIAIKNMDLVHWVIHKHEAFVPYDVREDLFQDGFLGLYRAIDNFDYTKGRFSTYAYHYIYRYMYATLTENKTIRIPRNAATWITRVNILINEHQRKYGVDISNAEIAKELEISEEKVEEIRTLLQSTISIDCNIQNNNSSGEDFTFTDTLSSSDNIEKEVAFQEDMSALMNLIQARLQEKEYRVIMMRFGFQNQKPMTLMEIGKVMGITRERVRQLEKRAIKKIQSICNINDWNLLENL